jgi:hypothetical protein
VNFAECAKGPAVEGASGGGTWVAVTRIGYVPGGVFAEVDNVKPTESPTEAWFAENVASTPVGRPDALNETGSTYPAIALVDTFVDAAAPAFAVAASGDTATLKSGPDAAPATPAVDAAPNPSADPHTTAHSKRVNRDIRRLPARGLTAPVGRTLLHNCGVPKSTLREVVSIRPVTRCTRAPSLGHVGGRAGGDRRWSHDRAFVALNDLPARVLP